MTTTFAPYFLSFVDASVSPFHAVAESAKLLLSAGFQRISETDSWQLRRSGRYFYTRNGSTLVAFAVGAGFQPGHGLNLIGAHTDSPVLRLKPRSRRDSAGYLQLGVQTYGGGLWRTWFDRDLSAAGRVVYRRPSDDSLSQHLVRLPGPVLRIPSLAIHLRPPEEVNAEAHLAPVLATAVHDALGQGAQGAHHPVFLEAVAEAMSEAEGREFEARGIMDFELSLFDTQPSAIGGLKREFIFASRLDNLMSSYCALQALIETSEADSLAEEKNVRVCMLFDHEEVGSTSYQGAASSLVEQLFSRINSAFSSDDVTPSSSPSSSSSPTPHDALEMSYARSFFISADMAHAVHPNYADKHESKHAPAINAGIVIKHNCNLRYATSSLSAALLRALAAKHNIPVQDFVVRQDSPCGSTIGPMVSAKGVRVVDVGSPQLSMHSIREMCGVNDVDYAVSLFMAYYNRFTQIDQAFPRDE